VLSTNPFLLQNDLQCVERDVKQYYFTSFLAECKPGILIEFSENFNVITQVSIIE